MPAKRLRVRVTEQVPRKIYKELLKLTLRTIKKKSTGQARRTRT